MLRQIKGHTLSEAITKTRYPVAGTALAAKPSFRLRSRQARINALPLKFQMLLLFIFPLPFQYIS